MTQATMERPSMAPAASTDAPIDPANASLPAMPEPEPRYQLIIDETVVEKISAKATQHIDGIIDMKGNLLARVQEGLGGDAQTKGVAADVIDDHNVRIDLDIILEYGKSATEVFDKIKETVGKDIDKMTGLNVAEMTVNVVDVMSKDEYASRSGSTADGGQGDAPRQTS